MEASEQATEGQQGTEARTQAAPQQVGPTRGFRTPQRAVTQGSTSSSRCWARWASTSSPSSSRRRSSRGDGVRGPRDGLRPGPAGAAGVHLAAGDPRIAEEQIGPYQQQVQHIEQALQDESIDALQDEFPQLADQQFVQPEFGPELNAAANELGRAMGLNEQQIEALRLNPSFIRNQYLARSAGQQAQQQAVAGGQERSSKAAPGTRDSRR
jgi:hypothetical protein